MDPLVLTGPGWINVFLEIDWSLNFSDVQQNSNYRSVSCTVAVNGVTLYAFNRALTLSSSSSPLPNLSLIENQNDGRLIPIPAGATVSGSYSDTISFVQPGVSFFYYRDTTSQ